MGHIPYIHNSLFQVSLIHFVFALSSDLQTVVPSLSTQQVQPQFMQGSSRGPLHTQQSALDHTIWYWLLSLWTIYMIPSIINLFAHTFLHFNNTLQCIVVQCLSAHCIYKQSCLQLGLSNYDYIIFLAYCIVIGMYW